ncbi:hypothetical protein JCM33374_g6145 [Metschnikowia sp. JCM 33374]|nr:hypothetical protein JCM33374_g6145 [Metschnikowia sp. JCM 33374]
MVVEQIVLSDVRGFTPRPSDGANMAKLILAKRGHSSFERVGKNCVTKFVNRQENLKSLFSRSSPFDKSNRQDPAMVDWFVGMIRERGLQCDDVYNLLEDEVAMSIREKSGNKNVSTVFECVSASGVVPPPWVIFKAKTCDRNWASTAPSGWCFEASANGRASRDTTVLWLEEIFIPLTQSNKRRTHRLVVLDGHASRLSDTFLRMCQNNKIIPVCMPSGSSDHLPLDGGYSAELKTVYGDYIQGMGNGDTKEINEFDFIKVHHHARTQALESQAIKARFEATGLVPYESDGVISKSDNAEMPITSELRIQGTPVLDSDVADCANTKTRGKRGARRGGLMMNR